MKKELMVSPKLKKGDQVVMHNCAEADIEKNKGRIWTCAKDSFEMKNRIECVFLEGYSGSFSTKFLAIVNLDKTPDESVYEMQSLAIPQDKLNQVIEELSKRGIMHLTQKSDQDPYYNIYYKADRRVTSFLIYDVL